jgi:hypothetical protein
MVRVLVTLSPKVSKATLPLAPPKSTLPTPSSTLRRTLSSTAVAEPRAVGRLLMMALAAS